MTFPDKLSDTSKQQLATQIDFFQAFTSRAFASAERILALNIETTRAALEQTTGAVRQLAEVRDPRDLLALTGQTQTQVEAAMAYSRKLFEIANQPAEAATAPAPAASAPTAAPTAAPEEHIHTAPPVVVSVPVEPVAAAPAEPAPAPEPDNAASGILPSKHPLGEADPQPEPAITAKAKPIARAAGKVAAAPIATPHPAASPMPETGPVAIPAITPVDAVAAPAEASPLPRRADGSTGKGSRKR